ncbi:N-glycosylase/DNA lyase isoform X1 [Ascaphus truei]|uniref:N-glycosylase/DNA lyase isoform X1 n=2 Tax=Ascaphus truei TaxID=8439 RepID=UPI003F59B051
MGNSRRMCHRASLSACASLWRSIPCPRSELRLGYVLACGQSFRWNEWNPEYWTGVLDGRVWTLTQTDDHVWYTVYSKEEGASEEEDGFLNTTKRKRRQKDAEEKRMPCNPPKVIKTEEPEPEKEGRLVGEQVIEDRDCKKDQEILRDYLQLNVSLKELYQQWGKCDPNFQNVAKGFPGVRVLRQDPTECLFAFICTSNNHISRITGMIERACSSLGRRLCQLDSVVYYTFPTLEALAAGDTKAKLQELGFGYRAKFVTESAQAILSEHGCDWLESLRLAPYEEARSALCALPGVGAKVADCVCLMALDKPQAVPVDTHVWKIAKRDYLPQLGAGNKSLTGRVYKEIGDYFRTLWGPYAGWAQSVLFCSELKKFQGSADRKKPVGKTEPQT